MLRSQIQRGCATFSKKNDLEFTNGLMDARDKDHGVLIPLPSSHTSMLGQLVYIDDTGAVVGLANVFESKTNPSIAGALRGLSDLGPVPPMVEETFAESVLMTTYGIEVHSMDKSKCERESP
jgi:hypothetical protein